MKDSTRRSLRTFYQGLLAAIVAIPTMVAFLPTSTANVTKIVAAVVAAVTVVSKVINALEEAGLIPAWLKPDAALPGIEPGTGDQPKDPEDMSETELEAAEELGTVVDRETKPSLTAVKKPAKKVPSKSVRQRNGRR